MGSVPYFCTVQTVRGSDLYQKQLTYRVDYPKSFENGGNCAGHGIRCRNHTTPFSIR